MTSAGPSAGDSQSDTNTGLTQQETPVDVSSSTDLTTLGPPTQETPTAEPIPVTNHPSSSMPAPPAIPIRKAPFAHPWAQLKGPPGQTHPAVLFDPAIHRPEKWEPTHFIRHEYISAETKTAILARLGRQVAHQRECYGIPHFDC